MGEVMPLGRCNPCPVALGGDTETGWTAAQQSRGAADAVALARAMPLAWITVTQTATTATVDAYDSQYGNGSGHAPTTARTATGRTTLTWPKTAEDSYGQAHPINIRGAKGSASHTSAAYMVTPVVSAANVLIVDVNDGAGTMTDGTWSLVVW